LIVTGQPVKKIRRYPLNKTGFDYFLFCSARRVLKILYRTTLKGVENIPTDRGYIICANHESALDFMWLTMKTRKEQFLHLYALAKAELLGTARGRQMFKTFGLIPIDRTGFVGQSLKDCEGILRNNWGLVVHPEGERTATGFMQSFKQGFAQLALATGVSVVPSFIDGAFELYNKNAKLPKIFGWPFRRYEVRVLFGKPISPDGHTAESLTQAVEDEVKRLSAR
jgi:1-acyl-sn-glycerol-3-phosphate acyltransferase